MAAPSIRDKAAIVGIGQTMFSKHLGLSEYEMAVEAIWNACDDAGISPREIDGIVRYDIEQIDEEQLLAVLGNPLLRYFAGTSWGGGGSASVLVVAAAAIASGLARIVLVYRAGAMAAGAHHIRLSNLFARPWEEESAVRVARQVFTMAECAPSDIDAAFFYDFFTSLVIIALEQYGFAPRGEGGPFVENGGLAWPHGRLVCNTNGGQLCEAFVHGFNNSVEAVRQIRGTSTAQLEHCELVLVAGGNTDPTGAVILRRD
ncbi:MAG: hypothetical protein ACE5I7_02975 [Candidatus Binatia bacterium]